MRIVTGITLALALTTGIASASVPARPTTDSGPVILERGVPFGIGSVYLHEPVWLPDSAPEIRALGITSAPGRGTIVVHAILGDTRYYYRFSGPQVRAIVTGDEAAVPRESSSWYIATWDRAVRPFLLKDENAVYVVRNVIRPTAAQPLAELVFAGGDLPLPAVADVVPYGLGTYGEVFTNPDPAVQSTPSENPNPSRKPL